MYFKCAQNTRKIREKYRKYGIGTRYRQILDIQSFESEAKGLDRDIPSKKHFLSVIFIYIYKNLL